MQLKILTLTGATFLLDLSSTKVTAHAIKSQLAQQIGFPASRISLVSRGILIGSDMESKPLQKIFPDFSSKDFLVLIYTTKKRKSDRDAAAKPSKVRKTVDDSSSKEKQGRGAAAAAEGRSALSEGKASASSSQQQQQQQQLSHLQEMRDFLEKFGKRRIARSQSRSIEPKEDLLEQLNNMGFKKEAATRALLLHRNNLEMSLNWLLENSSDPDINKPITSKEREQLCRASASRPSVQMEALNDFMEINFGRGQSPSGDSSALRSQDSEGSVEESIGAGGGGAGSGGAGVARASASATDSDNDIP
mmetsp:Transcript_5476/g.10078  ORF Transcript_5476/g.10078 Transcript_5476/m.10078 type:complete len:305 (-) Transcript_5476:280-1194(-)